MFTLLLSSFCLFIFLNGCTSPGVSSKGAIVNVYRINTSTFNMVCSSGDLKGISYLYVGEKSIRGTISRHDKKLIAQYARAVFQESGFITPVAIPSLEGEYPELSIDVLELSIIDKNKELSIERQARFVASFSIRQAGIIDCSTAEPVVVQKSFIEPKYKKDQLPSPSRLKEQIIRDAIRRVMAQLVPAKVTVLRPVKGGLGIVGKISDMIDAGNCEGAYQLVKKKIDSKGGEIKDADLLYNAGVALECMAWNTTEDISQRIDYLKSALRYYRKASLIKPSDTDIQRATKEVSFNIKVLLRAIKNQKKAKDFLKSFGAPSGF